MPSLIRFGALAAALSISPISPLLLVLIPLGLMLVALRPDDILALITGVALLVLAFLSGGSSADAEWYAHRAWPMLLGGGFVGMTLLLRRSTLFERSLAAVLTAAVAVAAAGVLEPSVVADLDRWMGRQIQLAAVVWLQWSHTAAASPEVGESIGQLILTVAEFQRRMYPAFLGLTSLPALAIGWYLLGRLTGRPEVPAPVREFRFNDHLVWVFAAGLALFILPTGDLVTRIGANAALFMTALYVVRGGAVIGWLVRAAGASAWTWILLVLVALLLYPVALGAAFVMGIGDTWLDVRERIRRQQPPPVS